MARTHREMRGGVMEIFQTVGAAMGIAALILAVALR